MTKKNYSKYEAKEELVTLSFNHVLLHKKDTKIYQVIFLSLLIHYYFSFDYRCKGTAFFAKHQKWACTYLQKSVNKTKFLC